MEGDNQITVKDWIEHIRFAYTDIENKLDHNFKFLIYVIMLFIGSLLTIASNTFVIFGIVGVIISISFIIFIFISNLSLSNQSEDFEKLLNDLMVYDDIDVNSIRIDFMEIASKYIKLSEKAQKRLKELKMGKRKDI